MVNSTKDSNAMNAERDLQQRVSAVEHKLDALTASLDKRFAGIDVANAEQQALTMSVFYRLDTKIDAGFARLDAKTDAGSARVDGRFDRLERKLDGFIDTQSRFNQIAERRLERLEQPDRPTRAKRR